MFDSSIFNFIKDSSQLISNSFALNLSNLHDEIIILNDKDKLVALLELVYMISCFIQQCNEQSNMTSSKS